MRPLVLLSVLCLALPALAQPKADALLKRGRYLVQIGGCNDCHTPGWGSSGGKVPEARWLTGDVLGWRGEWGTTYPINLRLYMQTLSESEWVKKARTFTARPPMPWYNVRAMSTSDLRAVYRYVRHLRPAGKPAPAFIPAEKMPPQPYVQFPPAPPKQ